MEKFQPDPNHDVVKEPFKGSGPVVAAAGYAYLSHLGAVIAGLVVGAVTAGLAYKHVNAGVGWARGFIDGNNGFRDKTIKFIFGTGTNTLEDAFKKINVSSLNPKHAKKLEDFIAFEEMGLFERTATKAAKWLGKSKRAGDMMERVEEAKLSAAFMGAGFGAMLGYVGSTVWAIIKGGHEGNAGKRQFERAKAEIASLRETNDNLQEIDNNLRAEYVKELSKLRESNATQGNPRLRIAADDAQPAPDKDAAAKDSDTKTALTSIQHQGTVAPQPELAAAPSA